MTAKTSQRRAEECVRLRIEERLSVAAIAARTGLSISTVSIIVKAYPLSGEEIRALQKAGAAKKVELWRQRTTATRLAIRRPTTGSRSNSTVHKGEIAFLKCSIRAAEQGMTISRPTIDCRYDAILDTGSDLLRVQIKYVDGKPNRGAVTLDLRRRGRPYLKTEVDAILGYLPSVDRVVWINADVFDARGALSLRLDPTMNGQMKRVRMVSDFFW